MLVGRVTWIFCEFEASLINTVSSRTAIYSEAMAQNK